MQTDRKPYPELRADELLAIRNVGFTGSRKGLSEYQQQNMLILLQQLSPDTTAHHGDCVGADATFHEMCKRFRFQTHVYPPTNSKYRAYCSAPDCLHPPKAYLQRNHDIVDASELLVATPSGPEKLRSGTWATIRYARKFGKRVVIIFPTEQSSSEQPDRFTC